jgi:sugar lactone lactonase YvrE
VNDVVVTRDAAYFTDSLNPFLYVVPLGPGGELPTIFTALPLTGDFRMTAGLNLNGITATPNGKSLIVVQTSTGLLFRVDPVTGITDAIDVGGVRVTNGDGLWLDGRTLYVVRNSLNRIAVVELDRTLTEGEYVDDITSPNFAVPTTIAEFGNSLYAVNARFGTPIVGAEYQVVRVSK